MAPSGRHKKVNWAASTVMVTFSFAPPAAARFFVSVATPGRRWGKIMACRPPRISQCQRTHAPMPVRIGDYDSMLGRGAHELGGSMLRSKILLARLALIPAAILMAGHSSLGEAKGDECKAKPDGTSPAGLHWYYRVDRANNRHCWYLHEQGMRVHSIGHATSRDDARSDPVPENDTTSEQIWKTP